MPGARALVPTGEPEDTRTAVLAIPADKPAPQVQVNCRGGDYIFHAARGGTVFQLEVAGAARGDAPTIGLGYDNRRLSSLTLTPKQGSGQLVPKVGMTLGQRQRAVFRWSGLTAAGGEEIEFKALPAQKGVQLRNGSGQTKNYLLTVDAVDGEAGVATTRVFGPFKVPAGAVHQVEMKNWPDTAVLLSGLDLDVDGHPDKSETVTGQTCEYSPGPDGDRDRDGLPDQYHGAPPPETTDGKTVIRLKIGSTRYFVNEEERAMDVAPLIKNERTLLPIRYVAEPLGATLGWDGAEQKATIAQNGKTIELWVNKNTARVNGAGIAIDPGNPNVSPLNIPPGRIMLPLRFIAETLGCQVDWNQTLGEVKVTYPKPLRVPQLAH